MADLNFEHAAKYYDGGFCPLELGDRIADRFTVLHKLGHGGYSTVWLVQDDDKRHGRYVALKVLAADSSRDCSTEETAAVGRLHLTLGNVVISLGKSLDALTVEQLDQIFGAPRTRSLSFFFPETPSPAPQYAVMPIDFTQIPSAYLSPKLCLIDFDHAFLSENPPKALSHIPPAYLAPENIFALINGPPADIWALGCNFHSLRCPLPLFQDLLGNNPASTVSRMCEVLGGLPQQWETFPFHNRYPVHKPLSQPDVEYQNFQHMAGPSTLEEEVAEILEPRPGLDDDGGDINGDGNGIGKFCLAVPTTHWHYTRQDFEREFLKRISKEEAALFADLLRQIFVYNHQKRLTARQVLEHPWFREQSQGQDSELNKLGEKKTAEEQRK